MNLKTAIEKLKDLKQSKIEEVGKCGYTIAIDVVLDQIEKDIQSINLLYKDLDKYDEGIYYKKCMVCGKGCMGIGNSPFGICKTCKEKGE